MRRLLTLLALILVPSLALAQTDAPVAPMTERTFVETMAARFDAQDAAPDPTPDPVVPPAPAEPAKPSETEPDPDVSDPAPEPPSSTPKEPDGDDVPDQPPSPGDTTADEIDPVDTLDDEFTAAATAAKVKLTVEDLPEEARPLVKKRIKELEAGFTKAMMDARSYRADEAKFRAEQTFQKENPAEYVADLLLRNPDLGEKVNVIIESITTPTAREAHDIVVEKRRADALTATEKSLKAQEARVSRGLELDSYARTAALKAGVPFELGVETAVIAHISSHGDITERDIDQIAATKAKEYENHTRAIRREASKKYVQGKVTEQKKGPPVKPGSGNVPAPAAKARPKNDAEFTESFAARM